GRPITCGTSSQIAAAAELTGAYQEAAETIGLKVVLRSVSAQNYINFFASPQARAGVDGFPTASNGDYADPAGLLAEVVLPGGLMNFDNFSDPKITADLEEARATANPDKRAALVAQPEHLTIQTLPCNPDLHT